MTCMVERCSKARGKSRNVCEMHYSRWKRSGTFNLRRQAKTIKERSKTDEKTGCIELVDGKSKRGYERLWVNGARVSAHRAAYQNKFGPIPKGMLVLHKCDNPHCINPDHLFLGTSQDNRNDMLRKGRQKVLLGETNPSSKLDNDDVLFIRTMARLGEKTSDLSAFLGVGKTTITNVIARRTWKHI